MLYPHKRHKWLLGSESARIILKQYEELRTEQNKEIAGELYEYGFRPYGDLSFFNGDSSKLNAFLGGHTSLLHGYNFTTNKDNANYKKNCISTKEAIREQRRNSRNANI